MYIYRNVVLKQLDIVSKTNEWKLASEWTGLYLTWRGILERTAETVKSTISRLFLQLNGGQCKDAGTEERRPLFFKPIIIAVAPQRRLLEQWTSLHHGREVVGSMPAFSKLGPALSCFFVPIKRQTTLWHYEVMLPT